MAQLTYIDEFVMEWNETTISGPDTANDTWRYNSVTNTRRYVRTNWEGSWTLSDMIGTDNDRISAYEHCYVHGTTSFGEHEHGVCDRCWYEALDRAEREANAPF